MYDTSDNRTKQHGGRWLAVAALVGALGCAPIGWTVRSALADTATNSAEASPGAQDFQATTSILPYIVPNDQTYRTVLTLGVRNDYKHPALVEVSGALTATNSASQAGPASPPGTLRMRVLIDGKPEPGEFATTIAAGEWGNLAGFLDCNGLPPGEHSVEIQAAADGAALTITMRAADDFRPIVIPPHTTPRSATP